MAAIEGFRQIFPGSSIINRELTVTENGGVLPSNTLAFLHVYEGSGQKLFEGDNYTINGSVVTLNFDPVAFQNYEVIFWTVPATASFGGGSCYDNIIGLSRTECPCHDPKPAQYNVSQSGLYLDELEPLNSLDGFDNCEAGSVWDAMDKARSEAVKKFMADSNALLMRNFKLRREPWTGSIGEAAARDWLESSYNYAGIRINCAPVRSGILKIKGIGTLFQTAGSRTAWIYNNLNQLIATLTLNTGSGLHTANVQDIELPVLQKNTTQTEYFIVYEVDPANKAKLNKIHCGCGGFKPRFDVHSPYWNLTNKTGANAWGNWVMVAGWQGNTLTDFYQCDTCQSCAVSGEYLNGLTLDIEIGCNLGENFCKGQLDFNTDPLALSIAYAIRYAAAVGLAERLMLSGTLNRANLINREALQAARAEWNSRYIEAVRYIAENPDISRTDCLDCKSAFSMRVGAILS